MPLTESSSQTDTRAIGAAETDRKRMTRANKWNARLLPPCLGLAVILQWFAVETGSSRFDLAVFSLLFLSLGTVIQLLAWPRHDDS